MFTTVYVVRMMEREEPVSAAEIARMAGVTRAAVSNWRRRHPDFPEPVGGTPNAPLFSLIRVRAWLESQGKGQRVSDEVRLWQALRAERGADMPGALTAVAESLLGEPTELGTESAAALAEAVAERPARELLDDLIARFVSSETRGGGEHVSTPALVRTVRRFAGETSGTVYDPACGVGDLLLFVGGPDVSTRYGQDDWPGLTDLVARRAELAGVTVHTASGDALRADAFPDLRADLVVCDPPTGRPDWGREELLLDPRWELGLPPKAEGDLAWLQHCLFHTAPGGRALVVLPASASYRRSGRRIRAELLRKGLLHTLVALPGGLAAGHAAPVHLWLLARRTEPHDGTVRLIDLSDTDVKSGLPDPIPEDRIANVPAIALLDDEVDLSPPRHVAAVQPGHAEAYAEARAGFTALLADLAEALPDFAEGERELSGTVSVNDLIKAGLVRLEEAGPVSTTDQLDTDFLQGFLLSAANVRRNTSGSGVHRADPRSARIPQMDPERQRAYGAAFRDLEKFVRVLEEAATLGRRAARLAREGLTSGALDPSPTPSEQGKAAD